MTMPTNSPAVEALEPTSVWHFFAVLSVVPRPSKREEKIRAHVRALAQELGFPAQEDATGNIVLAVPGSPGCENALPTVLQGHLDMVCEKNAGTAHDFDQDPIRLLLDKHPQTGESIVRADGTTLGADNGIGLALALAAATSPEVVHGPLEILCTVDEEMGMTGAKVLAPDFVRGRRMLNLDSEEDDALYIGCAGGSDTTLTWDFKAAPPPQRTQSFRVTVGGLRGGHSGVDIHLNRASAVKLLVRTLVAGGEGHLRLAELRGGSKRNVIPRSQRLGTRAGQSRREAVRRCSANPGGGREHRRGRLLNQGGAGRRARTARRLGRGHRAAAHRACRAAAWRVGRRARDCGPRPDLEQHLHARKCPGRWQAAGGRRLPVAQLLHAPARSDHAAACGDRSARGRWSNAGTATRAGNPT